jgi:hypothetical protein
LSLVHEHRASWTFEQWVRFLLHVGYADQALAEQLADGTFKITQKGGAFLVYVAAQRLPPRFY